MHELARDQYHEITSWLIGPSSRGHSLAATTTSNPLFCLEFGESLKLGGPTETFEKIRGQSGRVAALMSSKIYEEAQAFTGIDGAE